jgi:precorrin-6B methylase 2
MQTPYTEIRQILDLLSPKKGSTMVDLGCAYGRMAHVVGHHYSEVNFIGYELIDERVQEGNRVLAEFNYPRCRLETADLSDANFLPPLAEYYFIFDFGSRSAIEKILNDLKTISLQKEITIVARGRGIRNWIYQGHPWLYAIQEPQIFDHFSIFRP